MKKNKKRNRIMLLLILLLGLTIGFAALATTLKINGNASITKNIWSVYWEPTSVSVTPGSKGNTTPTVENGTDGSTNTKVTWSVNFELPGDFYEFTVDAANAGTLDAMITQITPTVPQDLPSYISYSVTYADGIEPAVNHILPKCTKSGQTITPTTEKYKIRIEFKNTITPEQMNVIPDEGLSYDFGYEVQYGQADENAIPVTTATTFQDDSFETIVTNIRRNKSVYPVGSTKTIEMDLDGDNTPEEYTLKVLNNSTPSECLTSGFSQTACGFVVSINNPRTYRRMNYYSEVNPVESNGDGNKGGWEYSDMRAYLNSGIYTYEDVDYVQQDGEYVQVKTPSNVDYTGVGIIDKLPAALKKSIIDTYVVSGHGGVDSSNFITTDKIYLLSPHEIWEDLDNTLENDTAYNQTRQLDYFKSMNITPDYYQEYEDRDLVPDTWLRSGDIGDSSFWTVSPFGYPANCTADESGASVLPVFRLAE